MDETPMDVTDHPSWRVSAWRGAVVSGKTTLGLDQWVEMSSRKYVVGRTLVPVYVYVDVTTEKIDAVVADDEFMPSHYRADQFHLNVASSDLTVMDSLSLPDDYEIIFRKVYESPETDWPEWQFGW